jgi:hypothetical protein
LLHRLLCWLLLLLLPLVVLLVWLLLLLLRKLLWCRLYKPPANNANRWQLPACHNLTPCSDSKPSSCATAYQSTNT